MNTPLSATWQIPRFRSIREPFHWIRQIFQLQEDVDDVASNCLYTKVSCITQVSPETWPSLSSLEIRNALPSKNRCKTAKSVKVIFANTCSSRHSPTEACACCKKLLNCSSETRNITRRCPSPCDFSAQLLDSWAAMYDLLLRLWMDLTPTLVERFAQVT